MLFLYQWIEIVINNIFQIPYTILLFVLVYNHKQRSDHSPHQQAERPESEVSMSYITSEQRGRCHAIIPTASASAGAVGGGLAQIPGSDSVPLCAIQSTMIAALGRVFGLELTDTMARAALLATPTAIGGRLLSQFLLGWIPVAGNIINAGTAASITEALGWALAEDFARETMAA